MKQETRALVRTSVAKLFSSNPVLVTGMIIGPVVVCATSLQNAAALSIAFAMMITPVLIFAATLAKKLPAPARVVAYVAISILMLIPTRLIITPISPIIFDSLGIYLPLLAVNSIVVSYTGRVSENQSVARALMDSLFFVLGFALAAFLLGGVRELLGSGTLWGKPLLSVKASALLLPFSGFILLGFLSAAVKGIKELFGKKNNGVEEEAQ